jgi:hypothetical protein
MNNKYNVPAGGGRAGDSGDEYACSQGNNQQPSDEVCSVY